jgi:hypothetical protein
LKTYEKLLDKKINRKDSLAPRDDIREEDLRGHGGKWLKKRLEKWERPGKELEIWPRTESSGNASWKPYAPEGVQGNN